MPLADPQISLVASPSLYTQETMRDTLDAPARDMLLSLMRSPAFKQRGHDFLRGAAQSLHEAFGAELLTMGRLEPCNDCMTSLVWLEQGRAASGRSYSIADTPCDRTLNPPSLCVYTDGIDRLFPNDRARTGMRVAGFAGAPLFGSNEELLGSIALYTTRPIESASTVAAALLLFGHRAALEMEQLEGERAAADAFDCLTCKGESIRLLS